MTNFYDRQGNPLPDVITWAKLYEDHDYRQVKLDQVDTYTISTIWMGFDVSHSLSGGRGLMWETVVLDNGHNIIGGPWRFATEERAIAGHDTVVKAVSEHPNTPIMGDIE